MAVGSLFQEAYLGPNCSELPDLSLSALQKRFSIPSELEKLYKRYEQRFQIGKFFRQITSLQMYCQRVLLSFHGFFLKKWNSESQNISLKISFFTTFLPSLFMETIWKFDRFIQKESHLSGQNIMKPLIKRQKRKLFFCENIPSHIITSLISRLFSFFSGTFHTYLFIQTFLCLAYIGSTAIKCRLQEVSQVIKLSVIHAALNLFLIDLT